MGNMQLNITPEVSGAVNDLISIDAYTNTVCSTDFTVLIDLTSSGYIDWTFPVGVVIQGGGVDEALAIGSHSFTVSIPGFSGFAVDQLTLSTPVVVELKDSEFGSTLDTRTVSRSHTTQLC
jgi:hypothetical protein